MIKKNIAVSNSGFMFDPSTGSSFSLNPIGLDIIRLLQEGKEERDIIKALLQEYDVDQKIIESDLYDFIHLLGQHQLIEKVVPNE